MKKVVFVDLTKKEFDRGAAEFAKRSGMYLPDEYDLIDWYQERDDVIRVEKFDKSNDTFIYEILYNGYSTALRIVHVIDVEQL